MSEDKKRKGPSGPSPQEKFPVNTREEWEAARYDLERKANRKPEPLFNQTAIDAARSNLNRLGPSYEEYSERRKTPVKHHRYDDWRKRKRKGLPTNYSTGGDIRGIDSAELGVAYGNTTSEQYIDRINRSKYLDEFTSGMDANRAKRVRTIANTMFSKGGIDIESAAESAEREIRRSIAQEENRIAKRERLKAEAEQQREAERLRKEEEARRAEQEYSAYPEGHDIYKTQYDKGVRRYDQGNFVRYMTGGGEAFKPHLYRREGGLQHRHGDKYEIEQPDLTDPLTHEVEKERQWVSDWYNDPETIKRAKKFGISEKELKLGIDKSLSARIHRGGNKEGSHGMYSPGEHEIHLSHGRPGSDAAAHELIHASGFDARLGAATEKILGKPKSGQLYLSKGTEQYGWLTDIRRRMNLKPGQKVTPKMLEKARHKSDDINYMIKEFDVKKVTKALNTLASHQQKKAKDNEGYA